MATFYGNKFSGKVSTPHGDLKGLKGLLEQEGYIKLTNKHGIDQAILKKFNFENKTWDFEVIKKREKERIDYLLEQGYEIEKHFNEKITETEKIEELEIEAELKYLEELEEQEEYYKNKKRRKMIEQNLEYYSYE